MPRNSISPGIYSGGAVTFNPQSSVQYYGQMLQHKQAKDEALGRYYQDLGKNINGAGMRTQDIESGWSQKVNDWQNFYNENADKIKYPNKYGPQAQNEFYSRLRDIHNDIDRSKEAGKNEAMVRQKMLDPKWREQTTDNDLVIAQNMSKPIYDQQHYKDGHTTPFGPEDFSFNAPRFDLNQQKAAITHLTQGIPRAESEHPTQSPSIDKAARITSVPMVAGYDKPTYDKIIERGVDVYNSGPSAQRFFENELHNPTDLEALNGPFKQYFGKDIASPQDVARAWSLKNVPQTVPGKDKIRNWTDPWESVYKGEALIDYREKKKEERTAADDAAVENFMKGLEGKAMAGKPFNYQFGDTKESAKVYDVPVTSELKKQFVVRVGAHLAEPDKVYFNPETQEYYPIFYKKEGGTPVVSNGKNVINPNIPTQPVAREAVKAGWATQLPKRAVKQLQGGTPATAPTGKTKSAEDQAAELLNKYLNQ